MMNFGIRLVEEERMQLLFYLNILHNPYLITAMWFGMGKKLGTCNVTFDQLIFLTAFKCFN